MLQGEALTQNQREEEKNKEKSKSTMYERIEQREKKIYFLSVFTTLLSIIINIITKPIYIARRIHNALYDDDDVSLFFDLIFLFLFIFSFLSLFSLLFAFKKQFFSRLFS